MMSTAHWSSLLPQKNYQLILKPRLKQSSYHDISCFSFHIISLQPFGWETLNLREPRPRMECQDWVQCAPVIRKEGMLLAPWFWERYGEICKIRVATIADCLSNVNLAMADGGFPLLIQYRGLILPSPVAKTLRDMSQCFQVLFWKKQVTSNFHRKLKTMMLTHWVMDSGPTSNCAVQCLHPTAEHIPNHSIQWSIRTHRPYATCLRFVVLVFK